MIGQELDIEEIKKYLLNLKKDDFGSGELPECCTISDLKIFGIHKPIKGYHIANYGEYFLVDLIGNDISLVKLTKIEFKTPTGRMVKCKLIKTIIEDCKKTYHR